MQSPRRKSVIKTKQNAGSLMGSNKKEKDTQSPSVSQQDPTTNTSVSSRSEGTRRRSGRQRIAPVEYWNGDAVRYDDDGTLIGIDSVGATGSSQTEMNNKTGIQKTSVSTRKHKKRVQQYNKKDSNKETKTSCRKRTKSSDIEFSDSIIFEELLMEHGPPSKRQKLIDEALFLYISHINDVTKGEL